ncbi:MAG: hypothetical protein EOP10_07740 [Proteobacteria bacterium]|nr:MAG: hypothetical protein EOP10_07740 [Pseudomonadota bacterium]
MRLWTLFYCLFFGLVSLAQANTWTPSTSDENGKGSPAVCENSLISGLKCTGRYCDNVSLQCSDGLATEARGEWSPGFSEENAPYICPYGEFVQSLACEGRYCDSVSVKCARAPSVQENACYWRGQISEENGGAFEFGKGVYLKGLKCSGRYCDRLESYVCQTQEKVCDSDECRAEQARRFSPILKFDQEQATSQKCFPGSAAEYWEARKNGDTRTLCNESAASLEGGQIPIYYEYQDCSGDQTVIMYWFFYGFQDTCSPGMGSHHADWERVAVKIKDGRLERVQYFQHGGSYTRQGNNFESVDGTHPIAYVGKNSHGSYHDRGGSGSCLYFEDYRNPNERNYTLKTEQNLIPLHRGPDAPEWMTSNDAKNFDGIPGPLARGENLCALTGCRGDDFNMGAALCFGNCGCSKSDIGNLPF